MKKTIMFAFALFVSSSAFAQCENTAGAKYDSTSLASCVGNAATGYTYQSSLTKSTVVSQPVVKQSLRKFICTRYSLVKPNDANYVDLIMFYSLTNQIVNKASAKYSSTGGKDFVNCVPNTL